MGQLLYLRGKCLSPALPWNLSDSNGQLVDLRGLYALVVLAGLNGGPVDSNGAICTGRGGVVLLVLFLLECTVFAV